MVREIRSAANPLIKKIRALQRSARERRESGLFIVEGRRAVETLIEHPSPDYRIERLVCSAEEKLPAHLPEAVEAVKVPEDLFRRISAVQHAQGILAVVRRTPRPFTLPEKGRFLLLDELRDPGNLGTLIRSAVGAGFDGVLLYGECADPFSPKAVRATMGTFPHLLIGEADDALLDRLRSAGFELCITAGEGGENLWEAAFGDRLLLAVGSEAHGIGEALHRRADRRITIPLRPQCESLNAAVAGSICMFRITAGGCPAEAKASR